jgi:mannose-1-phosphate guanylyltransferase
MTRVGPPLTHAVVLTAGLGTRLQPLTFVRAKPAVPVAGEPLVRRIIGWLVGYGVRDLVLNLHHLPHTVSASVGDGSDLGARVQYSWEQPQVLGTAGGPRLAQTVLGVRTFLVVNGDTLTDLRLPDLWSAHAGSDALVTLALVANTEPQRYGGVVLNGDGSVGGFVPRGAAATGSYHFIGVQAVEAEAFEALRPGAAGNSIGGVFDRLLAERSGLIRGYVSDAHFWDIGTVRDYWKTSLALSGGRFEPVGQNVRIHPSAAVERSIVWDNVEVGEGATIDRCILTDGVSVAPGSVFRGSVLLQTSDGRSIGMPLAVD